MRFASAVASGQPDYRLPTNVRPTHYDLSVKTDLEESIFTGVVKVDLNVLAETSEIVLNVKELKLNSVWLYASPNFEQTPSSIRLDTALERAIFVFDQTLPAGSEAVLKISFEGALTSSMSGYYRSVGDNEVYTVTQFEPTAARKAFPCWDEPLLKAKFTVTLLSRAGTVNISNMPASSESSYSLQVVSSTSTDGPDLDPWLFSDLPVSGSIDEWKITRFETSPPMATYTVAYASGNFKYLESAYTSPLSGRTRPLRVYAMANVIHQAQFALDCKRQMIPLYEQLFDIEYPLPKLDTLVIYDFDAGAMENWGLIIGRTSALLYDPDLSDLLAKKKVANVQCHELAHMWFGNITTMAWWDNVYLNEGFATLVGQVTVLEKLFPDWKPDAVFLSTDFTDALEVDAMTSSHAIEVECPDARMIHQIFDGLSYAKAASVLRMLSKHVGEDRFLKGVSLYLKKHLYGNSVTADLWEGIQAATGLDIPKMMDTWVKEVGYPVIRVTEKEDGIYLRQDRFLVTGSEESQEETIWTIPLSVLTISKNGTVTTDKNLVLEEREMFVPLDVSASYKLNAGTVSFYRVLYSKDRIIKIGKEASKPASPFLLEDRMGLVDDALALSNAGLSSVSSALSLIDTLHNEQEYYVWKNIASGLSLLRSVWWENPSAVASIAQFSRELFAPIVKRLGYDYSDDDSADTRNLRTLAIEQAAASDEESVVQDLRERFAHYMKTADDSRIPADLQSAIYETAVRRGGQDEWEAIRNIAQKARTPSSGAAAMRAMGATENMELAKATLEYAFKEARDADVLYFFISLSANPKTRRFLATSVKENFDMLLKRMEGRFTLQTVVRLPFIQLSSDEDYNETVEFFKDKDTSAYDMTLKQSLESIASRAAWIKRSTTDIEGWFETRSRGSKQRGCVAM